MASDIRKWFGPAGGRVGPDACSAASRARQQDRAEAGNRPAGEEDAETGTHANHEDFHDDFDELHQASVVVKKGARNFWVCRECGYNTGKHPQWHKRKHQHIATCHPELTGQMDERANRRATFVPYSEACCWRCPAPNCGLGLLANEATPKQRQTARLNHGKEAHPDLDQSLFHNQSNSAGNARKATIAKRNLGAARRIQRLADAAEAGHDPVWLAWPAAPPKGPRKKAEPAQRACKEGVPGGLRGA